MQEQQCKKGDTFGKKPQTFSSIFKLIIKNTCIYAQNEHN